MAAGPRQESGPPATLGCGRRSTMTGREAARRASCCYPRERGGACAAIGGGRPGL